MKFFTEICFYMNFFYLNCFILCNENEIFSSDPDEFLETPYLILNKGYQAQTHFVTTDDGYRLNIHRIPFGKLDEKNITIQREVVLLQHGLFDSSSTFVINFPEQSLGFYLADQGYDVWLGNVRGNTYGLNHVKYNKNQNEFWNFSWDEMAQYDFPAIINYILKLTGQTKLIYIGHSQGTLISFAALSRNPQLASKIKLFIALAPVVKVKHIKSPIKILADMGVTSNQQIWFNLFGSKDFMPSNNLRNWLADKLCNLQTTNKLLCSNLMFIMTGPSSNINMSRIVVYDTHMTGTSVKNMVHFAQMSISGQFQMFDYGSRKNNLIYHNQTTPPIYDLKNIQIPVGLYWAEDDWLADPIDVQFIRDNLPNIVDDFNVKSIDLDSHIDFIRAINTSLLNMRIVNLMKQIF